jgi:hypothetical protein
MEGTVYCLQDGKQYPLPTAGWEEMSREVVNALPAGWEAMSWEAMCTAHSRRKKDAMPLLAAGWGAMSQEARFTALRMGSNVHFLKQDRKGCNANCSLPALSQEALYTALRIR